MEFKAFKKIEAMGKLWMSITQKIHGTNALILIRKGESETEWAINAGSRTRWLTPDDDNYGFCKWVYKNKQPLIETLGEGYHYGEWAGLGINNGEGLKDKRLYLFNHRRYVRHEYDVDGSELPDRVHVVPELYRGAFSMEEIEHTMQKLKDGGSLICPGWMKVEGIVMEFDNNLYKKVFKPEETQWVSKEKRVASTAGQMNVDYLFQPIRLEKIISRDERFTREFPKSLPLIVQAYFDDLVIDNQFKETEPDNLKAEKKAFGREVFHFVKERMENE